MSVICPRGRGYDVEARTEINGVQIHRYRLPVEGVSSAKRFGRHLFILEYAIAMASTVALALRVFLRRPFHVIHAANPPDLFFMLAWLFAPFGVRFVFDAHDLSPDAYLVKQRMPKRDVFYSCLLLAERASVATADLVVATNESYRRVLCERTGTAPDSVVIVRNGPDLRQFRPGPPSPPIKEGFTHMVAYLGVMGKLDGVDILVRAAEHVITRLGRRDVLFVLMGDGTSRSELEQLAEHLSITPFVRFTGRVPDDVVTRYLATADVCAAPDPPNAFNDMSTMNKIMDYMAFGKPIVSFELRESRFSAGEAAVYVAGADPRGFGDAIVALLNSPEERERRGAVGLGRVRDLSWDQSARVLVEAYGTLWARPGSGR